LSDRVAVVTGAARGIGFATAQRLAEAGLKVALIDRSPSVIQQGQRLADSGHTAIGIVGDVSTANSVKEFITQVRKVFGPISILVNNAGLTLVHRNWKTVTPEQWDEVMTVNLKSMFLCSRAVISDMEEQKWGRIVNISSVTFLSGQRNLIDYVSAKGGAVGFSRTLAREVGLDSITVNTVTPGAIRTEAEIEMIPDAEDSALAPIMDVQAIKRRGTPDDVAAAIEFLCSDDAGFITGQNLVVDGGWMLN
jgi:NAD(P)-dependent dehydrogenase (short-subunit alcohol dehydrogenase family)